MRLFLGPAISGPAHHSLPSPLLPLAHRPSNRLAIRTRGGGEGQMLTERSPPDKTVRGNKEKKGSRQLRVRLSLTLSLSLFSLSIYMAFFVPFLPLNVWLYAENENVPQCWASPLLSFFLSLLLLLLLFFSSFLLLLLLCVVRAHLNTRYNVRYFSNSTLLLIIRPVPHCPSPHGWLAGGFRAAHIWHCLLVPRGVASNRAEVAESGTRK